MGGVFEVKATNGDTFLGGEDFDQKARNSGGGGGGGAVHCAVLGCVGCGAGAGGRRALLLSLNTSPLNLKPPPHPHRPPATPQNKPQSINQSTPPPQTPSNPL